MKKVLVRYHDEAEPLAIIGQIEQGDWIDLYTAETVELKKGEFKIISLGISIKLPKGYEAHIVPRSSTFKRWGVIQTNHMGVIDNSYSGDDDIWCFPAYATRDTVINSGDRICQFRIVKSQPKLKLVKVSRLTDKNRGGFGSTGTSQSDKDSASKAWKKLLNRR